MNYAVNYFLIKFRQIIASRYAWNYSSSRKFYRCSIWDIAYIVYNAMLKSKLLSAYAQEVL